ncbi:hypothetical protein U1Q18_011894, partial [Sarracenia purpurea var. burkii]
KGSSLHTLDISSSVSCELMRPYDEKSSTTTAMPFLCSSAIRFVGVLEGLVL